MGSRSEDDIAYLLMHYVDGYTRGAEWVASASATENDVDVRAHKDRKNSTLHNLLKDGRSFLDGRDYPDVMQATGHQIENLFSEMIQERNGINIMPLQIPEYIDAEIKQEIETQNSA
jgi:hypothetical protein